MSYVHGTVLKLITSSDEKNCVDIIARNDGLFAFRAYVLTEGDEYEGTYWLPTHRSGMYDQAEVAEAEAKKTVPWLRSQP